MYNIVIFTITCTKPVGVVIQWPNYTELFKAVLTYSINDIQSS